MPVNFKITTPDNSFKKSTSHLPVKDNTLDPTQDEELTTVFRDLHVSALSKAVNISPDVKNVTLGANSKEKLEESSVNDSVQDVEKNTFPCGLQSSTPQKNKANNLLKFQQYLAMKQKLDNLIPVRTENKVSFENGISHKKLLNEFDNQRRLTVDKVMRERIQNMLDANKLIRDNLEHLKQASEEKVITRRLLLERKILDDIHEQEILNKPKREAQWAKDNLKEAQRIQERNQRVKEAEEEARKKSESILLKRQQIDEIHNCLHKEYDLIYKALLETISTFPNEKALSDFSASQSKSLKDCAANREKLIKKCKQGDVTAEDVESAKKLVETIKTLREGFIKEVNRIIDEVKAKEEMSKKKEAEEKPVVEKSASVSTPTSAPSSSSDLLDCFDAKSLETYVNLKSVLETCEKTIEPLLKDDSMKKFRFNCQKAVNIPVNAISPVSGPHLSDKYLKLHNLLSGRTVEVGDIKITATQHPLGVPYCKYLLAKKFVRQGDLTVSSKPDAAFSIAAVLASLWVDFPDFGQLVLAHFQSACPYLAPVFMPQVEGQSDEDYHRSLGYHYSQNGEVEKQDSFLKRMSGIMRLYAAVLISNVRQSGKMNPLGLSEGWRWISALLNLEPRPDICATLLYDFLEVAGNEMFRAYGGQFKKVLAYICQEYFPKLEKVTPSSAGGPMVRLEGFLQKILKEESISPPHGVLPPNFW